MWQCSPTRLTLVADPDGLLTEEGMLSAIRERGFDLIPFDDSISFRYAYESQYRSQWDKRKKTDLVVVLRSSEQQLDYLPFDLLRAGGSDSPEALLARLDLDISDAGFWRGGLSLLEEMLDQAQELAG